MAKCSTCFNQPVFGSCPACDEAPENPLQHFNVEVLATSSAYDLTLLIEKDADLDGKFTAWDVDCEEFISVNGWLFTYEFADEKQAV